jgi:hypothetical protein
MINTQGTLKNAEGKKEEAPLFGILSQQFSGRTE